MATEILINDGGAPGRILPFIAGSTISAGDPLQLGVSLTAATSGNIVNCISGRRIIVRANCSGTVVAGSELAANTNGSLSANTVAKGNSTAILLEDNTGTGTLSKVLLL